MKVTIKKTVETKGMLSKKRYYALSLWVDLTKEEKEAIEASNLDLVLLEAEGNGEGQGIQIVSLSKFLSNSGPKVFEYPSAFSAHAGGESFKATIGKAANAIKAYQDGQIMGEESFEL